MHSPRPRRRRLVAAAVASTMILFPLVGCGQVRVTTMGTPEGPTIAVGVASDEPGLGYWHDGTYSGSDVDLAKAVARQLGYSAKQIVFKQVRPSTRVTMLDEGTVDMVVADFAMNDETRAQVAFAGPYRSASLDLLIRRDDNTAISEVEDMGGRTACVVSGTQTGETLQTRVPGVRLQERGTYPQCLTSLMVGEADAVAADDAVLASLMGHHDGDHLELVGDSYGDVSFGIAVKKTDTTLAARIQSILETLGSVQSDG